MAFSTQKDFFYVPFMNESVDFECRKACVQLKSYDSTIDDRSWAMDEDKKSNFLVDLVACRTPIGGGSDGRGGAGGSGRGGLIGDSFLAQHGLTGRDSVLECATNTLAEFEAILGEKKSLQKQLDISNENLKTANEENKKIRNIMLQKYDSSQSKDFYNKIQKLASSGKITKGEENELLSIYHKMENMNKAYEILQAENYYLKRLLEKLSRRATLESIKLDPETSNDVPYLQNTVNCLRREVMMLRKMEDEKLKGKYDGKPSCLSDRDAENLKAIIKERNTLRDKCKTIKDLEKKVQQLQKKTRDADHLSDSLSSNLDNQAKYIATMENEMKQMQTYYEEQMQKCKFNEELLKCQLEEMKEELMQAKCEAQKAEILQMEVSCLRNEVTKRDVALSDYDCQYKQLMLVINELQGNLAQSLKDTQTQTCADYMDDLAFFASATLGEIQKEMAKRCGGGSYSEMHGMQEGPRLTNNDECCREMERLKKLITDMERNQKNALNCEELCADALKRLKELEAENARLKKEADDLRNENARLNENLKNRSNKLDDLSGKVGQLDKDVADTAKETKEIAKDLEQSLKVAKDISDIQVKNVELAKAVSVINSRDDEKIIDDLRAQLEALRKQLAEEKEKNRQCQEDNAKLQKDLKNMEDQLAKKEAELKNLQDELDKKNAELKNLEDELAKKNAELKNLEDELAKKNAELKNLEDQLAKKNEPIVAAKGDDSPPRAPTSPPKTGGKKSPVPTNVGKGQKKGKPTEEPDPYDAFVNKNAENMNVNLKAGNNLEKELRRILDAFIQECGFCFCQCKVPKSKFYAICQKILHHGLPTITFRELVYVHKKIYLAAEHMHPGCLLNMILAEQTGPDGERLKCCNCKNTLCCNNSEEMLKEKVVKLERDIEMAKEYLDRFKTAPPTPSPSRTYRQEECECQRQGNATYRRGDQSRSTSNLNTKQLKQLKARIMKCSEFLR